MDLANRKNSVQVVREANRAHKWEHGSVWKRCCKKVAYSFPPPPQESRSWEDVNRLPQRDHDRQFTHAELPNVHYKSNKGHKKAKLGISRKYNGRSGTWNRRMLRHGNALMDCEMLDFRI
eukprot:TRINITY_DN1425_c1_g1_i1.p1 TRINITY_DN1425_c1_g1~~TRINITY_DN1425_c1_g1_i1.p1  ORF type:complete len:120 (+),score=14.84 TRINITY_DN1425_c1_g1_i1:57-416(+)